MNLLLNKYHILIIMIIIYDLVMNLSISVLIFIIKSFLVLKKWQTIMLFSDLFENAAYMSIIYGSRLRTSANPCFFVFFSLISVRLLVSFFAFLCPLRIIISSEIFWTVSNRQLVDPMEQKKSFAYH